METGLSPILARSRRSVPSLFTAVTTPPARVWWCPQKAAQAPLMQSWKISTFSPSVVVKIRRQVLWGMAEMAAYRAALLGMPAAFWISVTVKNPASKVNWRIRRRYSRRCSSTLAIVVTDIQDIADNGARCLDRSRTLADQRDLFCHIGLEGKRI